MEREQQYITAADAARAFGLDTSAADPARCRMMERLAAEGLMHAAEKKEEKGKVNQ